MIPCVPKTRVSFVVRSEREEERRRENEKEGKKGKRKRRMFVRMFVCERDRKIRRFG